MGWVHPPMLIIVNLHLWFDQLLTRDTTIQHKTSPRLSQGQQRPDKERYTKQTADWTLDPPSLISLDVMHPIHHIHQVILYFNKKLRNCEFEISKLQTKNYSQTVETTWTNKSWLIMMLVRLEVWAGQNLQSDRQNELELAHAGSNLITPIAHLAPSGVAPTSGASGLGSSNSWLCDPVWPYASVWLYAHVGQRWSSRSRHACWWLNLSNPNPNKKWIDLVGPSHSKRTMLIWMIWLGGPKSFHKNNNDIIDLKFGEATFIISSHQQDAKDASEAREVHKVKQPVMCKPPVTVLLPCLALLIKW
jgi:hypothetical protein